MADAVVQQARRGIGPIQVASLALGVVCLSFALAATSLQIETSEAFYLGGKVVTFTSTNWGLYKQVPDLLTGQLSGLDAEVAFYGWGIELVTLVFSMFEIVDRVLKKHNAMMATAFGVLGFGLLMLNGWSDFAYGNASSGFWGQLIFAGLLTFFVVFGWLAGAALIAYGIKG